VLTHQIPPLEGACFSLRIGVSRFFDGEKLKAMRGVIPAKAGIHGLNDPKSLTKPWTPDRVRGDGKIGFFSR
jgi:hypothetical protein